MLIDTRLCYKCTAYQFKIQGLSRTMFVTRTFKVLKNLKKFITFIDQ